MKLPKASILAWTLAATAVTALLLVGDVAYRHYRSSLDTFERSPPDPGLDNPETAGVLGLRAISFSSAEGTKISAWYSPSRNGAAVVLSHGTNADRSSLTPELQFLAKQGFGVLAYDGPGYGLSGGTARWGEDAEVALVSAVQWLTEQSPDHPLRIGGLGLSMGGYALIQAASRDPRIESVVLEAVPPDVVETTRWQHRKWGAVSVWPALWALRISPELLSRPNAETRIAAIAPRPMLLISGDQDQTVPLPMTERMFDRAADPKELWIVPGAGHGRYTEVSPEKYPAKIIEFFTRTLVSREAGSDMPP